MVCLRNKSVDTLHKGDTDDDDDDNNNNNSNNNNVYMNATPWLLDIRCRIFPSMLLLYLKVVPKNLQISSKI
jgi:hypothetical protein